MIVIFEGVDGTGKTTLINQLVKHSDFFSDAKVYHFGPPLVTSSPEGASGSAIGEYFGFLKAIQLYPNELFILDRFLYGELTYGKMQRGITMSSQNFVFLERMLERLGTVCFYMTAPIIVILERLEDKDDNFSFQEISDLMWLYGQTIARSQLPWKMLNSSANTIENLGKTVLVNVQAFKEGFGVI